MFCVSNVFCACFGVLLLLLFDIELPFCQRRALEIKLP